jgi:NAD(P)-dependent dehydrogenase (short-subunit alcohol dehydrogenase family)
VTSTQELVGKSAVVSGAGRGIGRPMAIALASRGAHVILLARSSNEFDDVVRVIGERGGDAPALPTDVGDPVALGRTAQRIVERGNGARSVCMNALRSSKSQDRFVATSVTATSDVIRCRRAEYVDLNEAHQSQKGDLSHRRGVANTLVSLMTTTFQEIVRPA